MAVVFATYHASAHRQLGCNKKLEQSIVELVGDQEEAFIELVSTVASEYADQVKADYQAFNEKKYMHLIESYRDTAGSVELINGAVATYQDMYKKLGIGQ